MSFSKRIKITVLGLLLVPVLATGAFSIGMAMGDTGSAAPSLVESAPPAAGSAEPTKPSDTLSNPASDPVAAWDDVKAAKKLGWPALVFACATMLAMAIGTLGKNLKQLAWLNRGRWAVIVGGVVALGVAGYNTAAEGGTPIAMATAVLLAAAAYWNSQKATA